MAVWPLDVREPSPAATLALGDELGVERLSERVVDVGDSASQCRDDSPLRLMGVVGAAPFVGRVPLLLVWMEVPLFTVVCSFVELNWCG